MASTHYSSERGARYSTDTLEYTTETSSRDSDSSHSSRDIRRSDKHVFRHSDLEGRAREPLIQFRVRIVEIRALFANNDMLIVFCLCMLASYWGE